MGFVKGGGGGGSSTPSGPAGGDLAGTYPNPTVDDVSILTTTGDLLYESSTGVSSRLGIGATGQVLTVAGGLPSWATPTSVPVSSVFGRTGSVVAATNDYTDAQIQNSPTNKLTTTGDLLYSSAANTLARLAIGTTGQVLGIAGGIPAWATPSGTEIGYDQITSPVSISATSTPGTTIISGTAHTFDGAPVILEFFAPYLYAGAVANITITFYLYEGATQLGQILQLFAGTVTNGPTIPVQSKYRFTPSTGSHTYTVTAACGSSPVGTSLGAGASGSGAFIPAFVRITKV